VNVAFRAVSEVLRLSEEVVGGDAAEQRRRVHLLMVAMPGDLGPLPWDA